MLKGCSDPTPEHGTSNNTDYSYGSVVEIFCDEGFDINGITTIVCQPDGIWSENTTCSIKGKCVQIYANHDYILNALVTITMI